MKTRPVVIHTGAKFRVPENIQRIDTGSTHGWQLRYGEPTKFFSDGSSTGQGAKAALEKATAELKKRVAKLPAPTGLQKQASRNKTSDLPVGISGPIIRRRSNKAVPEASFSVSVPRYGEKPRRLSVYIGSENTYTVDRYKAALERAIDLRRKAEEAYQAAATKAKRAALKKA
jgi:hypothetical protein